MLNQVPVNAVEIPASWKVVRLAGSLGAEITGARLANASEEDAKAVAALLSEHQVVFFPDQHLSLDEHVALGRYFGEIEGHPNLNNPFTQHTEVFELAATQGGVADEWHTDITFQKQPALMSILQIKKCPPAGGDTMWSSLYAAYEALSQPMKDLCESLSALHDALPHNRPDKMAVHPVVRVNPHTGRKALYVNEHFTRRIVEMNATESDMLLDYLTKWIQLPLFTVRYRWTEGTLGIWDNRFTQHYVLNDFDGERIIHRVTVMGDEPQGVKPLPYQPWVREGRLSATSRHDRQLFLYLKSESGEHLAQEE